ncbi:acyl-CoA synthetase (NDP forming) [Kineococcus xinjiangensis]|uniref:Acyl-CoA synthetase (NDP forming) n=1 Tax=Kineococcus xinjiangensis TaxID=512762 RepID=A0A2S6IVR2_9ACTN|nr:acyl-CoA synthetase (NDP forming) [Kineococcus xinjiangensis]
MVLRDGGTAHVRPITPADADAVARFHERQSDESRYLRFFAPMPRLSARDLQRFTVVDHDERVALVATVGDDIVGIARYDAAPRRQGRPVEAEVAFNISDAHQGRGLGSVLLEHLAAAARERGVGRFTADVLPQNGKMINVFREAGYEVRQGYSDGVLEVSFAIDPTERSVDVMRAREQRAEARSMASLLAPASVVVVGASRNPGTVGHRLLADIVSGGFRGSVHAVNADALPDERELLGVPLARSLRDVPAPVDLAVIAVPPSCAVATVAECAALGVRGLVVVSSGFAETGPHGLVLQRELVRAAHANGMRVVGPNSFGLINTDPEVRLNASLNTELPAAGRFGLFSQSGALGVAVLSSAARRGLGVSTFVSAGNRADVSGNDCMHFWAEDERTTAVGLYLESVGNPRKFSRVARSLSRRKPVVVVKSGMSSFGVPPGHAVRPSRVPFAAFDAMLRQAGVIRVENVHQLFDVAQVVVDQPLPTGDRVAVVGNSDALATLAADAAVSWGLRVVHGPTSVHPEAGVEEVVRALEDAMADPEVDAVVASYVPPTATVDTAVAAAVAEAALRGGKTCVTCFLGTRTVRSTETLPGPTAAQSDGRVHRVVPSYPTPEDAVRALASAVRYAEWRRRDPGRVVAPEGVDLPAARELVKRLLAAVPDDGELDRDSVAALLATAGLHLWPREEVSTREQAVAAALRFGWPVALKTAGGELSERQDLRGVRLGLGSAAALSAAFDEMREALGPDATRLVVQPMAPLGVPCQVRSMEDPLFGPVVSFGLEGDPLDLLDDIAYRIPPLTDVDVSELVRCVKASPRLLGHRGAPVLDVPALEDVIARVAVLADALPEIADLKLGPVLVAERGASVLDAAVRVATPPGRADADRRVLPS